MRQTGHLETPEMKLEEIHMAEGSPGEQDQQGQDLRSKCFGPESSSPKYELRTSNKNEMWPNVSTNRRVESPFLEELRPRDEGCLNRHWMIPTKNGQFRSFMVLMVDWFSKPGLSRISESNLNQQMRIGRVQLLACPTVLAVLMVVGFSMQGL